MKTPFASLGLLIALTTVAHAELNSVSYDFNNETNSGGVWSASTDPWVKTYKGGQLYVDTAWSDSKYIAYSSTGAGYYGAGAISGSTGTATAASKFSLQISIYGNSYWGTSVGFGNGVDNGIALGGATRNGLTLRLGLITLANVPYTFTLGNWYDLRLDIDLSANAGEGNASAYIRAADTTAWTSYAGLTDVNLNLTANSVDPTDWDTLWFVEVGSDSGVDDLSLTVVPEPAAWASMLTGGGLLLAGYRRKKSQTAAK